ncbi:hypothetical protein GCM10029964_093660 [Kibdelosporangium lantanae]
MAQIFLNYRKVDADFAAALLDQGLSERFGSGAVFLASKSIALGVDWEAEMFAAVERSLALLVVMGRNWLTATKPDGTRCVDDPADFVRREIIAALDHGKKIVPVRLGIDPPPLDQVPEVLRPAMARQGIQVRFRSAAVDIDHLAMKLRNEIPELRALTGSEPAPAAVRAEWIGAVNTFHGDTHISGDFNAGPRFG